MIAQQVLATPKLVFEPVLPELVLVTFAIFGLLYEALAKRSEPILHLSIGLSGVILAAATTIPLWSWDGAATVLGGTVRPTASPSSRDSSSSSSPRSACSSPTSTSRGRATSGRASSRRSCYSRRRG